MKWVMLHKGPELPLRWARRCVTRQTNDQDGSDQFISNGEFEYTLAQNSMAMHWAAHEIRYGIKKIELESNREDELVLINGSRAYFSQAITLYPHLRAIHVSASHETLKRRLLSRARESEHAIANRLLRSELVEQFERVEHESVFRIENNGELEQSARLVLNHLMEIVADQ